MRRNSSQGGTRHYREFGTGGYHSGHIGAGKALKGQVEIRPVSWRDFQDVLRLERVCFGRDAWSWLDVLAALTYPDVVRLKAQIDDEAIGIVIGDRHRSQGVGWIATIGVHPRYRRLGVARQLLQACEDALAVPTLRLTLRISNLAARNLYASSGYQIVDQWSEYYSDGEDGLVMEKQMQV
jgi:ribosomal protein S18 acetylase RimI-like enzyme